MFGISYSEKQYGISATQQTKILDKYILSRYMRNYIRIISKIYQQSLCSYDFQNHVYNYRVSHNGAVLYAIRNHP